MTYTEKKNPKIGESGTSLIYTPRCPKYLLVHQMCNYSGTKH